MPNIVKGTLWAFSTPIQLQKILKNEGGPLETLVNFGKKAEKNRKAGPFSLWFCRLR